MWQETDDWATYSKDLKSATCHMNELGSVFFFSFEMTATLVNSLMFIL
jgi:hypothetical protein